MACGVGIVESRERVLSMTSAHHVLPYHFLQAGAVPQEEGTPVPQSLEGGRFAVSGVARQAGARADMHAQVLPRVWSHALLLGCGHRGSKVTLRSKTSLVLGMLSKMRSCFFSLVLVIVCLMRSCNLARCLTHPLCSPPLPPLAYA